jgi:5-methylcytosine-specific restriction protein A
MRPGNRCVCGWELVLEHGDRWAYCVRPLCGHRWVRSALGKPWRLLQLEHWLPSGVLDPRLATAPAVEGAILDLGGALPWVRLREHWALRLSPSGCVVLDRRGRTGKVARVPAVKECTWCGGAVKPPRRTWCSTQCVDAYDGTLPTILRRRVWRRDHGKCSKCLECDVNRKWEMDHRTPLAEGGHPFDLSNLRTLCVKCHAVETAALRRRLSELRSGRSEQGILW